MPTLSTYISLPGTSAEAMQFWQDVFGGDLTIMRYGDMDLAGLPFTPPADAVAHAELRTPGGVITSGDSMGEGADRPVRDTSYSLLYTTDSGDEAHLLFEKLLDGGGTVSMPLEIAPWGDLYGQVTDRFGVTWAIDCSADDLD